MNTKLAHKLTQALADIIEEHNASPFEVAGILSVLKHEILQSAHDQRRLHEFIANMEQITKNINKPTEN